MSETKTFESNFEEEDDYDLLL